MYQMEFTQSEMSAIYYALKDYNSNRFDQEIEDLRIRFEVELDNTSLSQHVENWEKDTNCKANGYMLGTSGVMVFYDDNYWSDSETKRFEGMGFTHHRL